MSRWLVPVAVLAVFWPCLCAGLVYDDWWNFDRNHALREHDWLALVTKPYYGPDTTYWRPIPSLAMGLAYLARPFGVHLLALVAHALAACAVAAIGRLVLGDARSANGAALLFALHPLQVESVAWASALPGVLSGLFVLLAMRTVLAWSAGTDGALQWPAFGWLLAALLSKESGIVAVPLVAIAGLVAGGARPRAAKLAVAAMAVAVGALWFVGHVAMVGWRPVVGDEIAWVPGMAQMAVRQLALLLVPWPLTPFRAHPGSDSSGLLDLAAVSALTAGVVLAGVHLRLFGLPWRIGGALLAGPLLLSSAMFDAVGPHPLTDRYLYVAVAGFALCAAASLGQRTAVWMALAIAYGSVAFAQCHVWRDDRSFVAHVASVSPTDPSVRVLAATLALRAGDAAGLQEARDEYRIALELWPDRSDPFTRRQRAASIAGLAWCDFCDPGCGAERCGSRLAERFAEALRQDPRHVPAWVGLGVAHALNARFERAEAAFASALAIDPWCPEAWLNLARTQFDMGCAAQARESLRRALRCNPCLQLPECLLAELR